MKNYGKLYKEMVVLVPVAVFKECGTLVDFIQRAYWWKDRVSPDLRAISDCNKHNFALIR